MNSPNILKIPKLTDADRDRMEGLLSYEECKKALDTFQNNKAPGEDGFTVEFYTFFFFDLLGHDLVASFNAAYDANELTISQRRGVSYYSNSQRRWLATGTIKLETGSTA